MTLKKVSADEWRKMGLPTSTTTISFISYGGSKKKEKSIDQYKDSCDEGKDQKL